MTNSTRKWIRGGLETLIHGGTAALTSSMTASMVDGKDWGLLSTNQLKLAAGTFVMSGGIRFLQWWQANPLPPDETAPGIPNAAEVKISLNPLGQVQPLTPQPPVAPPA